MDMFLKTAIVSQPSMQHCHGPVTLAATDHNLYSLIVGTGTQSTISQPSMQHCHGPVTLAATDHNLYILIMGHYSLIIRQYSLKMSTGTQSSVSLVWETGEPWAICGTRLALTLIECTGTQFLVITKQSCGIWDLDRSSSIFQALDTVWDLGLTLQLYI